MLDVHASQTDPRTASSTSVASRLVVPIVVGTRPEHIPVLHVEAGLRTGGNNKTPFPEDRNRQLISSVAGLHFAPTSKNHENLVREDVPVGQIFVTGNTGIDALQWASQIDVRFAEMLADVDRSRAIVVVADADGRLDPEAPRYAASHGTDAAGTGTAP